MSRIEINVSSSNVTIHSDADLAQINEGVPFSVTRRQFKLALLDIGILDDVEAEITASGNRELRITWEEALDFERLNPMVEEIANSLGKSKSEIDALFILAKTK